ncbi:hypothetical protein CO046_02105 [Candidatus Peregrinibacteria bacterium CG_4_9_14_0_2_um_filter_53_11]|nr:MAG: hypothetical protein CO046_02105 [Candidatus Peregrinibacteria bacterium CG_4_9_14_0_2_um_filter_53_11]
MHAFTTPEPTGAEDADLVQRPNSATPHLRSRRHVPLTADSDEFGFRRELYHTLGGLISGSSTRPFGLGACGHDALVETRDGSVAAFSSPGGYRRRGMPNQDGLVLCPGEGCVVVDGTGGGRAGRAAALNVAVNSTAALEKGLRGLDVFRSASERLAQTQALEGASAAMGYVWKDAERPLLHVGRCADIRIMLLDGVSGRLKYESRDNSLVQQLIDGRVQPRMLFFALHYLSRKQVVKPLDLFRESGLPLPAPSARCTEEYFRQMPEDEQRSLSHGLIRILARHEDALLSGLIADNKYRCYPEEAELYSSYRHISGVPAGEGFVDEDASCDLVSYQPGDRAFLCSDGVTAYLDRRSILSYLRGGEILQLVQLLERIEAHDNLTGALIRL